MPGAFCGLSPRSRAVRFHSRARPLQPELFTVMMPAAAPVVSSLSLVRGRKFRVVISNDFRLAAKTTGSALQRGTANETAVEVPTMIAAVQSTSRRGCLDTRTLTRHLLQVVEVLACP